MKFRYLWVFTLMTLLISCSQQQEPAEPKSRVVEIKQQHYLKELTDVGIDFQHDNTMQGDYWPHEILGPGAGVLDVDGDGDLDLYLRQGSSQFKDEYADQLYLNQWIETGAIEFVNVTQEYGIKDFGYGMGVTFGDIDNDGDLDIFLSNYGIDVMLENQSGRFVEVNGPWQTKQWSTSATFVDINRDGWLDLYVGKYNKYQLGQDIKCFGKNSQIDYCSPKSYPIEIDSLYLNQSGNFVDISESSGIQTEKGYTLAVVVEDFDADGWPDILTANDATKNFLWINQKNNTFKNEGLIRGVAVNGKGEMEASMGIGLTDFENDLDWDFIMTHLSSESNTLYVNNGQSYFMDKSNKANIVSLSKVYTAFGVGWLDVNNDQLEDLIVINGAVNSISDQRESGVKLPLKQKQQVLIQQSDNTFNELQDGSFSFLNDLFVGRSAIFVDLDNDGDKDILISTNSSNPIVIANQSPSEKWVGLDLHYGNNTQALGSAVKVYFNDGSSEIKRYHNDGSYLSGNDPRIIIKWIDEKQLEKIVINWPNGGESTHESFSMNQYQIVKMNEK